MEAEIARISERLQHIRAIVVAQQEHATRTEFVEEVSVEELLNQAVALNDGHLGSRGVDLHLELDEIPPLHVARHKVLQILVNLLRNATDAMRQSETRELRVRAQLGEGRTVVFRVQDTGIGMSEETLAKIFTYGFTTKPDGHGFGLHASILAAREMGGTLEAHSDGHDCGSTFTITLPLSPRPNPHATAA